jgi:phospholipase/lecithinase/hemolysin
MDEMREAINKDYGFVDVTNYCCPFCGSKPDHEPNGEACIEMMVERHHEEIRLK